MYSILTRLPLFRDFSPEALEKLLEAAQPRQVSISAGDIVALKGASCHQLIFVLSGRVRCEVSPSSGEPVPVERLRGPGLLMPGLLYAPDHRYPAHWVAETTVEIASIPRGEWSRILQQEVRVLENFLALLSDSARPLSDQVMYRSFKTIKGKFARYLLDQAQAHGSDAFRLPLTQRELSELFGVTRPALARAMGEMVGEGAIYLERRAVKILFPEKLQQYIGRSGG